MSRIYFNGVSNLSFNGSMLSFALDDTYQNSSGKVEKGKVIELMSDLNSVEGICNYLLGEIEKIKTLEGNTTKRDNEASKSAKLEDNVKLKLGKKISSSSVSHN